MVERVEIKGGNVVISSGGVVDRKIPVEKLRLRRVVQVPRFIPENMSEETLLEATFFKQDVDQKSDVIGAMRTRRHKKIDNTKLRVG